MLRQKTLLGETYVQLSRRQPFDGSEGGGGRTGRKNTVQLDEIFDSLDPRDAGVVSDLQQELAKGVRAAGATSTTRSGRCRASPPTGRTCCACSRRRTRRSRRWSRTRAYVRGADREGSSCRRRSRRRRSCSTRPPRAMTRSPRRCGSSRRSWTSRRRRSQRLQTFSTETDPLVQDLTPVARDLKPTLADVHALAPDLEHFFRNIDLRSRRPRRACGRARDARRRQAAARRARPVPRPAQPDAPVSRAVAVAGVGLHLLRWCGVGRHHLVKRRRRRPLPAPVRPARRRERGIYPERLPPTAGRPTSGRSSCSGRRR